MRDARRRLERLEQVLPRWPASVEEAKQRCLARLKVRIGEACGCMEHPAVVAAMASLVDDSPAQDKADRATLQRYAAQYPRRLYPPDNGLADRIEAKLEEMARRQEANREP
jgi:hypothetical protein